MFPKGDYDWITKEEWQQMLRHADSLQARERRMRLFGEDTTEIWKEIGEMSRAIRSPRLKVVGIDDGSLLLKDRNA